MLELDDVAAQIRHITEISDEINSIATKKSIEEICKLLRAIATTVIEVQEAVEWEEHDDTDE